MGVVELDSRGPNPESPWGWSIDGTPVGGDANRETENPAPPGAFPSSVSLSTNSPIFARDVGKGFMALNLCWAYNDAHAIRSRAHALFPDARGLDAKRHSWATRQVALKHGVWTARMLGFGNEVIGAGIDIWEGRQFLGAFSRPCPCAFQFADLSNNEVGIGQANDIIQQRNQVPR